jgi:hypothetical protein
MGWVEVLTVWKGEGEGGGSRIILVKHFNWVEQVSYIGISAVIAAKVVDWSACVRIGVWSCALNKASSCRRGAVIKSSYVCIVIIHDY